MTDSNKLQIELIDQDTYLKIPDETKNSKGFIIYFPHEHQGYIELYKKLRLKKKIITFLTDIISLFSNNNEFITYIDIQNHLKLSNKPSGSTLIYSRANSLVSAGIFSLNLFKPLIHTRKTKIFTINLPMLDHDIDESLLEPKLADVSSIVKKISNNAKAEQEKKRIEKMFSSSLVSSPANRSVRDVMMSSLLAKCLRLDSTDQRKKLVTNFLYKNSSIDVTTSTQTDGNIAISSDIRYTMVITTFCLEHLKSHLNKYQDLNKPPGNLFVLDLNELCAHVGNRKTSGNRNTVYSSIKRLYQTNFEIKTQEESEFANRFLEGYDESNYRFLTDFSAAHRSSQDTEDLFPKELEEDNPNKEVANPRWIRISLWQASFNSMWNQVVERYKQGDSNIHINYFIQNPEVVKNKAPLACHLYSHLCSWVGVSGNVIRKCDSSDLFEYMLKTSKHQNFMRSLLRIFNQLENEHHQEITVDSANFEVNFYGFIITAKAFGEEEREKKDYKKGFNFTFKRDKKDPYIGDGSKHNRLKKQTYIRSIEKELGKNPHDIDIPPAKELTTDTAKVNQ
jgi:hypothetical protein